ncbi:hypothetical protein [Mucilaginibacter pocheonensis]|uniref:Thioredoxin reductase n=1 Tax=Mucilaginibacter pocheonensis TaxID=398050 RepID=A0ABU1TFD6_9SPHI|nr:hypothetical protein [Mucilaginibacter pocheonensis]MDR6943910.1 thioredoxin reductase [Mucilaginibacter pocheonensis]
MTGFFVAIGHQPTTEVFGGMLDMHETGYTIAGSTTTSKIAKTIETDLIAN